MKTKKRERRYVAKFKFGIKSKIICTLIIALVIVGYFSTTKQVRRLKRDVLRTVQSTQSLLNQIDQSDRVSQVVGDDTTPDQVFTKEGKNLAVEIFKHMDRFDKILTTSLKKAEVYEIDESARYRLQQIDRNTKEFNKAYKRTVVYVINGGIWKKGLLINTVPEKWDGKPTKYDNIILGWKKVPHFGIVPSLPL